METEDSKKPSHNKLYKRSKNRIIDWWDKQHIKNRILIVIILCSGLISLAGISGALVQDKNSQKIDALNQIEVALEGARPIISDTYNTLNAYKSGSMDTNTAISKLQADKTIIDGLILQLQKINPPNELQPSRSLAISTLYDLSASINLGIEGINNKDSSKINQAINMDNNATTKFDRISAEVYKLRYQANKGK